MSVSLILTFEDLHALTGTKQVKRMVAWLESRNWVFEAPRGRSDIPKVDRTYYLARMSGQGQSDTKREKPRLDFMTRG